MSSRALMAALGAVVVIGGGVVAATQLIFRPSNDEALSLVPADAQFYMNVFVRPSNGQKRAIEDLLQAGDVTADEAQDGIASLVDRALEDVGLTFEQDIDPALDNQVAILVDEVPLTPDEEAADVGGALLIAVRDEDKAQELAEVVARQAGTEVEAEETYTGYQFTRYDDDSVFGFVEGFAVVGTEAGFEAVVDTAEGGDSLADSDAYQDVISRLNDDNLGVLFFNLRAFLDQARGSGELTPEDEAALEIAGDAFERPFAMTAFASSQAIVVESAGPVPSDGPIAEMVELLEAPARIEELPADSWFALGIPEVGRGAELFLELVAESGEPTEEEIGFNEQEFGAETGLDLREHVFEGLKGVRLFFAGGIGFGTRGGLIVETSDEGVATDIVDAVREEAESQGVLPSDLQLTGYEQGFSVTDPSAPEAVHVVADGARIVAGFGEAATRAALEGDEPLVDSEKFASAAELLGDDYEPYFYLDLDPPLAAFRNFAAPQIPGYPAEVLDPFLDAASHFTAGSKRDGDYVLQRVVIGVEQESESGR